MLIAASTATPNSGVTAEVDGDVNGTDRVPIPLMTMSVFELWDVLVLASWAAILVSLDTTYVWPCVVASACTCMRDRDLEATECIGALYMLRHTCGAIRAPTQWLSIPVVALAVWARFASYLNMENLKRRFMTLAACFICLALLHSTEDNRWVAFLRLCAYTAFTRYSVHSKMDAWDAIAQCVWMLCCIPSVLILIVPQLNDMLSAQQAHRRRPRSNVWTEEV